MSRYSVKVNNEAIARMFRAGGEPHDRLRRAASSSSALAKAAVHSRTGELAASIRGRVLDTGLYGVTLSLSASAKHASFVEFGTDSPILPVRGVWLRLSDERYVRRLLGRDHPIFKHEVRGQRAQAFLRKSVETACRAEKLLVTF